MKFGVKRSPLFYVGDKYKLMAEIKTHFPARIRKFAEPFVGGGSVFMNVAAEEYILNDIDTNVIEIHKMLTQYVGREDEFLSKFYEYVRKYKMSLSFVEDTVPQELKTKYVKTYFARFNKEGYLQMRKDYNASDRSDFLMLYVLLIYGFNRMLRFNKSGDFNLPVGNVDFNKNTYNALIDYFHVMKDARVSWQNSDFRLFFANLDLNENDLVYCDPPYLITFSEYNKLWNDETEIDLLNALDELNRQGKRFAVSNVTHYKGRENVEFIKWSQQYNVYPIKSNYISYHDNTCKSFNEVLVTNY
ncbi:MAG: Dam family site-specific DNA-(adenine-N6)-methyltransferase [Salinivirgaceae bacterium]|nr:Dam family site-specific DNA-(adenine-N6)-methyltransferase [Salinivirgaceae bacterium]